jgi:uncharacterized membrane protein
MGGLRRYLELRLKAQIGLSSGVVLWALIALVCAVVTFVFLLVSAFIWLADRYDGLIAALVLAGSFLLLAIVAMLVSLRTHRGIIERAELALAAQKGAISLDPSMLGLMMQVGRGIGWRKVIALLPVVIIAAGVGMQLLGRQKARGENHDDERTALRPAA